MDFHPCPSCTEIVLEGTCVCPHCGDKACARSAPRGVALLLGLSLAAGCGPKGQAVYSAPVTDTGDTAAATERLAPEYADTLTAETTQPVRAEKRRK